MQTILITGASGQLGAELKEVLAGYTDKVCYFLDRKQLPLEQTLLIQDILGMYQPDLIIHAGAYTAVDKAEAEPDLADRINHLATEEIAQYCRLHGTRLIAISTDYVFDGTSDMPLPEDAPVNPINAYGMSKWRGEQAIQKWLPDGVIIRTSWVYSTYGHNFVKTILRLMQERDEISVVNDQVGSPTYAHNLAVAIARIMDTPQAPGGIYHYSDEGQLSWYDFAVTIRNISGLNCTIHPVPSEAYPTAAKRPHFSLLDKSKIKRTFNIEVPCWKDSLRQMLGKLLKIE